MMLQLSGVHAHYGYIHALHGVDVSVQVGEVVTLIGANGAGKSTLMMSIFRPAARLGRAHRLQRRRYQQAADA
jgi:branched-chain amino acid transport system ATP-binding protein